MSNENAVIALADELTRFTVQLQNNPGAGDAKAADRMERLHGRLTEAAWLTKNADAIATVQRAGDAVRDICRSLRADVA
jgi:hypothetical protein